MIIHKDLLYSEGRLGRATIPLTLDLFLPKPKRTAEPSPLVVWFHGGGFRVGDKASKIHRVDARWFTKFGYAFASINYRLGSRMGDLSSRTLSRATSLQANRDPNFRLNLSSAAALAALEDSFDALIWLQGEQERFNLSNWIAVGGNSAGAINAFNVVHLASFFSLARPAVQALISISGGFAYPDLYNPALAPVYALHNPNDPRVDIASIRKVARKGGEQVKLIESKEQSHGQIRLSPTEPRRESYARIFGHLSANREADT